MSQLRGRTWTKFQIEAEIEHFGEDRIVQEHNALLYQVRRLHDLLTAVNATLAMVNDAAYEANAYALMEAEEYLAKY